MASTERNPQIQCRPRPPGVQGPGSWREWAVGLRGPPDGKLWISQPQGPLLLSIPTSLHPTHKNKTGLAPAPKFQEGDDAEPASSRRLRSVCSLQGRGSGRGAKGCTGCELTAPPGSGPTFCPWGARSPLSTGAQCWGERTEDAGRRGGAWPGLPSERPLQAGAADQGALPARDLPVQGVRESAATSGPWGIMTEWGWGWLER